MAPSKRKEKLIIHTKRKLVLNPGVVVAPPKMEVGEIEQNQGVRIEVILGGKNAIWK